MEQYPAFDERPVDKCLADVAACDVYVLLVAHRYGYVPQDGNPLRQSITELEYEQALHHDKSCLVFCVQDRHPWSPEWMDFDEPARGRLQAQGDLAGALQAYRDALAIIETLVRIDVTNAGWQRHLFVSRIKLALVFEQQGDGQAALDYAQAGLRITERLAALDPSNATWRKDLSFCQRLVTRLELLQQAQHEPDRSLGRRSARFPPLGRSRPFGGRSGDPQCRSALRPAAAPATGRPRLATPSGPLVRQSR